MPSYKTRKFEEGTDDSIDSPDTPSGSSGKENWHALSFLAGSICYGETNDVGDVAGNAPWEYNPAKSDAREFLRRHTVEPGMSTFSWQKKP